MENTKVNNMNANDANAFFDEDTNSGFKFKDLVFLILRNLHWFIICAAIGGVIAYYNVRGQERIYSSRSSLLVKTAPGGGAESFRGSAPMSVLSGSGLVVSTVNNEMMMLKSRTNMENMVRKLNLCMSYSFKSKMTKRVTNLYKESPIEVMFPDMDEQANASIVVKLQDKGTVLVDGFGGGVPTMKVKLNDTVVTPVGRMVVAPTWRYDDYLNESISVRHAPLSSIASSYRSRIRVSRDGDRNAILRLSLEDTSPLRAADALNTLMDVYNQESIEDQQRVLNYTEEFINERINYLMNDIEDYEQVFVDFKRSHNLIDTKSFGQTYMANSTASTQEEKQLVAHADMIRYLIEFVKDNEGQIIPIGMTPVTADASAVISEYNSNLVKLEKHRIDGTINNPVAQNLIERQVSLRSSILTLLETNLVGLESRIAAANREKNIANSQIQTVPVAQLELSSVERMQGIKESLYLQLLTRREDLLMKSPQLEPVAKIVDYAYPNTTPIAPNESRALLVGLLIGLAIPIAIMFLINMLDTTIHDRIDVQKSSNVPFLGDVPFASKVPDHTITVRENGRDSLSESFRLIRSNLEYMKDRKDGAHVVMFTSFMVSSGKTFISSNMAMSFALLDKKVLIVGLDIRKPRLLKIFNIKRQNNEKRGITDFLSSAQIDFSLLDAAIINNGVLDILPSGTIPPNPAELLSGDRLKIAIDYLKPKYDYILLDTAPVGMVADTLSIGPLADASVYVCRANFTPKEDLDLVSNIDDKLNNICMVINDIDLSKQDSYGHYGRYGYRSRYGYYRHYYNYKASGYGYGFGYGYGERNQKEKDEE